MNFRNIIMKKDTIPCAFSCTGSLNKNNYLNIAKTKPKTGRASRVCERACVLVHRVKVATGAVRFMRVPFLGDLLQTHTRKVERQKVSTLKDALRDTRCNKPYGH